MTALGDEETCPAAAANGKNTAHGGSSVGCPRSRPKEAAASE
jgi:hypothetical protein